MYASFFALYIGFFKSQEIFYFISFYQTNGKSDMRAEAYGALRGVPAGGGRGCPKRKDSPDYF